MKHFDLIWFKGIAMVLAMLFFLYLVSYGQGKHIPQFSSTEVEIDTFKCDYPNIVLVDKVWTYYNDTLITWESSHYKSITETSFYVVPKRQVIRVVLHCPVCYSTEVSDFERKSTNRYTFVGSFVLATNDSSHCYPAMCRSCGNLFIYKSYKLNKEE